MPRLGSGFHRQWRDLTSHLIGIASSLSLVLAWLHWNGALDGFVYQDFMFGYFYFKAHPAGIAGFRLPYLYYLLVPIPFLLASVRRVIRKNGDALLIFLWLLAASVALMLTGRRLYAHYFVILAAPMTLALANAWIAVQGILNRKQRLALAAAFFSLLAGVTAISSRVYFDRASSRISGGNCNNIENPYRDLAEYLNAYPLDRRRSVLFVGFGNPAEVALLTNTRLPKPFAYFGDFFSIPHPLQNTMIESWVAEIKSEKPTVVIEDKRHFYSVPESLTEWIKENYVLVRELGEFRVFAYRSHGMAAGDFARTRLGSHA